MKILLAFLFSLPAYPAVLMLDLNNGDKEVAACTSADPGNVFTVNERTMKANYVDEDIIEEAITNMEKAGKPIDTLVISGHHGVSGEFFGGKNGRNGVTSEALRAILARHPITARNLRNIALAGCYTGTVDAGKKNWLRISPNVTFTMGFPLQAPSNERPLGHQLLKEFCSPEKRAAAARAGTKEALCEFYRNMPILEAVGASVSNYCYGDGSYNIASKQYGAPACFSFKELEARCADFDPGNEMKTMWDTYYEGYKDPPPDGSDVYGGAGANPIRKYYDKLHLWRHCKDNMPASRDYDMPSPSEVIRMAKFIQIRDNINRLNREELQDYDERLSDLGLDRYRLGDLTGVPRSVIRRKVFDAMKMLNAYGDKTVNGTNTRAVWRMAYGLNLTFVEMASQAQRPNGTMASCSRFSLVHAGNTNSLDKSKCIVSYDTADAEMNSR